MALVHVTATRNAMADACVDLIDAEAGDGYLEFQEADNSEAATISFSDATAFGAAGASNPGEAIAGTMVDDASAAGGVVTKFRIYNGIAGEILQGTVTTVGSGGDIEMTSLNIAATDQVSLTSLTYTAST